METALFDKTLSVIEKMAEAMGAKVETADGGHRQHQHPIRQSCFEIQRVLYLCLALPVWVRKGLFLVGY